MHLILYKQVHKIDTAYVLWNAGKNCKHMYSFFLFILYLCSLSNYNYVHVLLNSYDYNYHYDSILLSSIKCIIIYPNATMKDCNKFDTGMTEPKVENLWSNPFVFSSTIKYLKYKKMSTQRVNARA